VEGGLISPAKRDDRQNDSESCPVRSCLQWYNYSVTITITITVSLLCNSRKCAHLWNVEEV